MLLQTIPETFRTVDEELLLFGGAILLGIPAGILFDITRLLRKVIHHHSILIAAEDILYFISVSFLLLCYTSAFAGGEFRFYFIIGCLIGFIAYYCTLGVVIMRCSEILLAPVRWFWNRFVCICGKLRQTFVKCAKKSNFMKKSSQNSLQNPPQRVYNKKKNSKSDSRKKKAGRLHDKRNKNRI